MTTPKTLDISTKVSAPLRWWGGVGLLFVSSLIYLDQRLQRMEVQRALEHAAVVTSLDKLASRVESNGVTVIELSASQISHWQASQWVALLRLGNPEIQWPDFPPAPR